MKIVIDTESLLGRAYVAAVVGPTRRPQGRAQQVVVPPNASTLVVENNTDGRVLFCTAMTTSALGAGLVLFTKDAGTPPGESLSATVLSRNFTLYPGEKLYAVTQGINTAVVVNVTSEPF